MTATPHEETNMTLCRGLACRPVETMPTQDKLLDRSMLFQSSLQFTF
jgi:hypothetical protein